MTELELMRDFGNTLKRMLKEWGMSQKELADEACLSESTISRCVRGEYMPSAKTLVNIAIAFNCNLDDLIYFDEIIY